LEQNRAKRGRAAQGESVGEPVDDVREQIQKLLITGDNRLKQGVAPEKVRASYEQALELAREHGLEETIGPLVEIRLADLEGR
jgi:hypothetical protein